MLLAQIFVVIGGNYGTFVGVPFLIVLGAIITDIQTDHSVYVNDL